MHKVGQKRAGFVSHLPNVVTGPPLLQLQQGVAQPILPGQQGQPHIRAVCHLENRHNPGVNIAHARQKQAQLTMLLLWPNKT